MDPAEGYAPQVPIETVARTARELAASQHPRDALKIAARALRDATGAEGVALLRVDGPRSVPAYSAGVVIPPGPISESKLLSLGHAYPLVLSGKVRGLVLLSRPTVALSDDPDRGLESLLDLAALSLRNFRVAEERVLAGDTVERLSSQTQLDAERFRALHELAVVAAGELNPTRLASAAANLASVLLNAESAAIYWWNPALERLVAMAQCGSDPSEKYLPASLGAGIVGYAYTRREAISVDDFTTWKHREQSIRETMRSGSAVPLWAGSNVVGVLVVKSIARRHFSPTEVETLTLIGAQIGPALASAHYYRQSESRRAMAEALAQRAQESEQVAAARAEALTASEERYREIVEAAHEGIWHLDAEGRTIFVNPRMAEMLEYTVAELQGRPMIDLVHPEWRGEVSRRLGLFARGLTGRFDDRFITRSGKDLWTRSSAHSMIDGSGSYRGLLLMVTDISESRAAEIALRESEERLRQAQKMESIGLLAGGVAHDFNNLLTAIIGFSDMVTAKLPPSSPLADYMNQIVAAGERASELTRQLLAFSRQQVLQPEVTDLRVIVDDMVKLLRRVIGEHIELETINPDTLGNVLVDRGEIEQVLLNLAINARDAMPSGGKLTIETRSLDAREAARRRGALVATDAEVARPSVLLRVTDTGCGMDEATRERIFEPFFTTKESGKGTGLGLATVYGIVKQSGGDITVTSQVGMGATFEIILPVHAGQARSRPPQVAIAAVPGGGETVLVVEDEIGVRALARSVLEAKGYTVLDAESGEAALALMDSYPGVIDLVVSDLMLPGMNGRELVERMIARTPAPRFLYMSGYSSDVVIHTNAMTAQVEYLQKPFTPAALATKVRAVLNGPLRSPIPRAPRV
ncbi:MAG TPA: ATP-binding protein [Chloroflexota bacterium]|nr:ATP-binding protein [Chloroflexota bacterium]